MFTRLSDIDMLLGNMNLLRNKLSSLYYDDDRFYGAGYPWELSGGLPRTNLYEDGDNFQIMAEVPGLKKEDLQVKIQGNYLEIAGNRGSDVPEGYKIHKAERGTVSFSRSFTLPMDVDATRVEALLKNGMLYMTLPKAEAAKSKKIAIN
jgi:HSP20 family protein